MTEPRKQTMKGCMLEQPDTIRRVMAGAEESIGRVDRAIGRGPFDRIYLIGSGTSLHAAIAAKYAFLRWLSAEVQVMTPFEFEHYFPHRRLDARTLVLGISQTARSIGTIHCVEIARQMGSATVFVTAEPGNPGAASAHAVLDTCTGEERVGAKTKGFTSTAAMLILYAAHLADAGNEAASGAGAAAGSVTESGAWAPGAPAAPGAEAAAPAAPAPAAQALSSLASVPAYMEEVLRETEAVIGEWAGVYAKAPSVTIVGGGMLAAAAKEGGLKMLEGVRIPVEVYDAEEYMHGPYHCLEKGSHLIFMDDGGPGSERVRKMAAFAREHSEHVSFIGYRGLREEMGDGLECFIPMPGEPDDVFASLWYVIPLQWLTNDATLRKGRRPEQSRYPDFHGILGSKYMPPENYYGG